ncbi:hypothetical protein G7K_5911-t1 [Saitoella complicata NRRL Y-17804]|uniref:Uncharacterized protein n=1 Tax=Saitoella complicata (strain BCRC 22490 / CBS 7301 / JCM 7358 / NBRC 10748 / NRRL Y-17804) TaxID=698492 RepID=A0A0E9NQW9_SAICN|nr:hypothetical protein G7K_5911-t1 [Saitoella complicata NRRL Y-17804]
MDGQGGVSGLGEEGEEKDKGIENIDASQKTKHHTPHLTIAFINSNRQRYVPCQLCKYLIPVTPDPRPPQSNSLRYLHLLSLRRFRAIGYHSSTSMAFLIASLTTFDSRLRRIEHLLSPPLASADDNDAPATTSETEPQTLQSLVARLAALDKSVNTLLAGIDVNAIQNVIPPSSLTSEEEDLSIEQKRAIITSPNTPDIRQITSNLHTLQSLLPIPTVLPLTSSASPSNTATAQRLTDLRRKLEEDAAMSNQLRRRTVEVLEVYAQGVQEVNEWRMLSIEVIEAAEKDGRGR